ncbi:hypothetical protein HIM_05163 [Hirsutella minnesotensis 3608]|uniref:Apple domain-containing protein n=1 Tax=Hirsutella minnesotensis 3608 TaxID=1043627 RepID=A0A0F8A0L9_9HYPO|nr:hypothetical protein HIM_05163 [Hirsutella minnesotensis 3608]
MRYTLTAAAVMGFALTASAADACIEECNRARYACLSQPDAHHPTCASNYATCIGYNPYGGEGFVEPTACSKAPEPTVYRRAEDVDECAKKCSVEYNVCRGKPNAHRPTCASDYASCLGFNPFTLDGSLGEVKACVKGSERRDVARDACATKCYDEYNSCRGKPDAHRPTCASELARCVGYNPFTSDGSLGQMTACSKVPKPTVF